MPLHVGVDFGTTNSALAVAAGPGEVRLATFVVEHREVGTFRSILHAEAGGGTSGRRPRLLAGHEAIARYLEGNGDGETSGRLVQSLKSHLASPLFTRTSLHGQDFTLEQMIGVILRALRESAERQLGPLGDTVVAGRPVRFWGATNDEHDALATGRLREAFALAGFRRVELEHEPVAAAFRYATRIERPELVLIADFGGGTSDFSLVRLAPPGTPGEGPRHEVLGSAGVAVGGDSFDTRILRHLVGPELGDGSTYRTPFGRDLPLPAWIYKAFERWHHLSFLRTQKTLAMLGEIAATAAAPRKVAALTHVIEANLGFALYRSVERSKHALSHAAADGFVFREPPAMIEMNLARADFDRWIAPDLAEIEACVDGLHARLGIAPAAVDRVFMTGGSSLVPAVRELFARRHGADRLRGGGELTSVAEGLALRAASGAP